MMNISKVQAHKLPKAATSTLQLVSNFSFPDFFHFLWLFPGHFGIPWLFQVFQVSSHPGPNFAGTSMQGEVMPQPQHSTAPATFPANVS